MTKWGLFSYQSGVKIRRSTSHYTSTMHGRLLVREIIQLYNLKLTHVLGEHQLCWSILEQLRFWIYIRSGSSPDWRKWKENFSTGNNELTTRTKPFLGGKPLQPPGSAACDICQPHSKQLLSATQQYRVCTNSRIGCNMKFIWYWRSFGTDFPHSQCAQVRRHHTGHKGQPQHKGIALPIDITLKNSRCKLIWSALAKKEVNYFIFVQQLSNRALSVPLWKQSPPKE